MRGHGVPGGRGLRRRPCRGAAFRQREFI